MTRVSIATCLLLITLAASAVAAPFGNLATTACTGQGVTVTFEKIDWLPAGSGAGCINTAQPTDVTYVGGGPLGAGTTGLIKDLNFGAGAVIDFMTFTGHQNLHFDLLSVGPGAGTTICSTSLTDLTAACSVFAGSPFVLRPTGAGTVVTLTAFGEAWDLSDIRSKWQGTFSVDFAGESPAQLQTRFLKDGSITSGHSGSFAVTPIPEPATFALMGAGLLFAGMLGRRLRK